MQSHGSTASVLRRVLAIISEIRSGSYPTKSTLARRADCDPRTIQRDLTMLRGSFRAPIEYSRERGGFYLSDRKWRLDG